MKFQKKKNVYFFKSLGNKTYVSLMKIAYFLIGNSSSGILEAPSFGTPTINIGNRQSGRIISKNIINCDYDYKSLRKAFFRKEKNKKKFKTLFSKEIHQKKLQKKYLILDMN